MARRTHHRNQDFLPTTREEIEARGWDEPDVILVSGDAYIDHPSFAAAILGRWLEKNGFRVAILAQPDWRSAQAWKALGRPRLFYGVSAGNMDSMINHYTANRKKRNADAYSPGGAIDLRPDRATNVYVQRCREAFKGVPVIAGGVEASLRRLAHYDYWSDKVWPSILLTSKAHLVVFGMGERPILEIARRLNSGEMVENLRDMRGVAYLLGKKEALPDHRWEDSAGDNMTLELPTFEDVQGDPRSFAVMTRMIHRETNAFNARRLVQAHGDRRVVVNPADLPLSTPGLDALHDLPYARGPHPRYRDPIPAWDMIKDSVQIMRGCFGGCTFCSITLHQGRPIQSRSRESVVAEISHIAERPGFGGHISDLGGPTANMYRMRCSKPEVEAMCRRPSCVHPTICKILDTSHKPLIGLMRESRRVQGVKKVNIASGIRMDLARQDREYLEELVEHHVGGHLKVAPEHSSDTVLSLMKKPPQHTFEDFSEKFREVSRRVGKEQYLVPYFISSHPGSGVKEMIELAVFLKKNGYKPLQVQDFIPAPMDVATCMYHTDLDPHTMKRVFSAKRLTDRKVQRVLLQFFKPENWAEVREILLKAGRKDLIGSTPGCLISAKPPQGAWRKEGRRTRTKDGDAPSRSGYRHASRGGTKKSRKKGQGF
ncbi:MAG: YgiQ family radical SAM protein [Thermoanaerobaculales bacterium]|nr:YgiQ family radical SAM protein [Thermoanaerobaculales bacterium]